jgi:hypothetical protein
MSSTIQLGTLLEKDTSRGCFPSQPGPVCLYKWEVDYRGFNEAIKVTSRATTDLKYRVQP